MIKACVVLGVMGMGLAACGGNLAEIPPPPSEPPQARSSTPPSAAAPAAAPSTAATSAPAAAPASKPPEPATPAAASCGNMSECARKGLASAKAGDVAAAQAALTQACTPGASVIDACAQLVALAGPSLAAEPAKHATAARAGCSPLGATDENKAIRGASCLAWGNMLREGKGADKDADRAARAFEDGCKIGNQDACKAGEEMRSKRDAETGVPGATMRAGRVTTDGVTVEDIACKPEGGGLGGLLGTIALGKPFADRKQQLDACSKTPHKTRVRWVAAGGKMTDVKVISGENAANKCIEKALAGAPATVSGMCAASVEIGKK